MKPREGCQMGWPDLKGHDQNLERLGLAIRKGRLASTFLFVGPAGIGKRTFAIRLAAALLCQEREPSQLEPCAACSACQQVLAGSHPDLAMVAKPADKSLLPIELFVGDRDHRGRAGLCHQIALKPACGGYRVGIIDDADLLGIESANCLLKTLEEPPPKSVLILIATSQSTQLPTIRSRCQVIRFRPLTEETVAEVLLEQGACDDLQQGRELARRSDGSLEVATSIAAEGSHEFRPELFAILRQGAFDASAAAREITQQVNQSGKDTSVRRRSLRETIQITGRFYQQLMRDLCAGNGNGQDEQASAVKADDGLMQAVGSVRTHWRGGADAAASCVERCVDALQQLASNANVQTLIECWLDDLSRLARGQHPGDSV